MGKIFILQKDYLSVISKKPFPIKSGAEFWETGDFYVLNGEGFMFPKEAVEYNSSWFKLKKEEKIEVNVFYSERPCQPMDEHTITIKSNIEIPPEKYEAVKEAIEYVLNQK